MNLKLRQYDMVARTYGEALLGAARRQGVLAQAQAEAKLLLKVVKQNPRLLRFLESPHVPAPEKLGLLDRAFKGRLSPLMINLLHVLALRRRTTYLDETLALFQELAEQSEGLYQAVVTSAAPLSAAEQGDLKAALEKYTQSRLKIDYSVDPDLLGGIVFRFRDLLIDGSLRNGLDELRQRLAAAPLSSESA